MNLLDKISGFLWRIFSMEIKKIKKLIMKLYKINLLIFSFKKRFSKSILRKDIDSTEDIIPISHRKYEIPFYDRVTLK